jgi:hypothetical protein
MAIGEEAAYMKLIVFLVFFLVPGLAIIFFAQRAVAYNARLFPRVYGRAGRALALAASYAAGVWWIVQGLQFLLQ